MEERCDAPCACQPSDRAEVCYKDGVKLPSTTELIMGHEKARSIVIRQKDYGYTVEVGCQEFCIEKLDTVLDMLSNYLHNPQVMEEMWRKGELVIESNIETKSKIKK